MTLSQSGVNELLDAIRAGGDIDVIRKGVELVLQGLIEAEATEQPGAARRIDRALFAVVMEADVHGVSTRTVDDPLAALGAASGIPKSEASRICSNLDGEMAALRARRLDRVESPYLLADATCLKGRVGGQVVSRAVVVVTGVTANGEREVLGCAVGDTDCEDVSAEFFRSLRARGLRLVVSDHHDGLKNAIAKCFVGAGWTGAGLSCWDGKSLVRFRLGTIETVKGEAVSTSRRYLWWPRAQRRKCSLVSRKRTCCAAVVPNRWPDR